MESKAAYLRNLCEKENDKFNEVALYMARDLAGVAHPNVPCNCVPPCSGKGSTPNGYWVCSSGCQCVWIPL